MESASPSARSLAWAYVSDVSVVPGTLVDAEPEVLQDRDLNSSFVVRLTRSGKPVAHAPIQWEVSDPTARIQVPFAQTDEQGLARAWLVAGIAERQEVVAGVARDPSVAARFTVCRSESLPATEGRYVTLFLDAPGVVREPSRVWIEMTPDTDPSRTYYQLITAWGESGQVAFYGGLQQLPCPDTSGFPLGDACSDSRGAMSGNVALLTMWDCAAEDGSLLEPRPVLVPSSTVCQRFDHEGNGMQCMTILDWTVGSRVHRKVEKLSDAPVPGTAIAVSASIDGGLRWKELGRFELPEDPDLASIAAFNENWGGASAPTCQEVEVRSMTIHAVRCGQGDRWYSPSDAVAATDDYPGALSCLNFEVVSEAGSGIRLTSGGPDTWVDFVDSASYVRAAFGLGLGFLDLDHARSQYATVDPSTVEPLKTD